MTSRTSMNQRTQPTIAPEMIKAIKECLIHSKLGYSLQIETNVRYFSDLWLISHKAKKQFYILFAMEKNRLLKLRGKSRKAKAGVLSASAAYSNVSSVDSDETLVAIKGNALRAGGQKDLGKASKQKESNLPDASINNYSLGKEVVHGPRIRDELKAHRLSSINLKIDSYGNTALHMAAARNDYVSSILR